MGTLPRARKTAEVLVPGADGAERRRHGRVAVAGVAAARIDGRHLGIFSIADLSAGGASLVGEALLGPGQLVELELQVAGRTPLTLTAKVLRRQVSGARGRRCAVRFEGLTPAQTGALAAALLPQVTPTAGANVLVLWARPGGSAPLERDLGGRGLVPLFASTPLQAAAWLRASGLGLQAVLVDYLLAGSDGWDFLQHLREHHPNLRRVLLVDGIGNFRLNLLLASGLADSALEKPWTAAALAKKLGA
jgi:CheY-like chemotaxis protein